MIYKVIIEQVIIIGRRNTKKEISKNRKLKAICLGFVEEDIRLLEEKIFPKNPSHTRQKSILTI